VGIEKNLSALKPADINNVQLQPLAFQNLLRYGNILFSDRSGHRTCDRSSEHIGATEALYLDIASLDPVSVEQLNHPPN
jgi:hypothetical protein